LSRDKITIPVTE